MKLFDKYDRNSLFIIFEGIAYTTVLNLYNPFIQMFGKRMGARDIHIALLNSMPPLVAIFVLIPFGILIEKLNRKKQTTMFLIFLNSLFYAAIAFVPFISGEVKVILYIILIGLMNFPGSLYLATWQSFFADTFSGSQANTVYSLRSKYGSFFGLLTVLLTGLMLTTIPKTDEGRLIVYQVFYAACFAITLLQLYFLSKVEQSRKPGIRQLISIKATDFKDMLANRKFTVFCLCAFIFHFTWQMGWPLFFIYNADYAKLNEFQLGLLSVASGVTTFLTYSLWSRLMSRSGSRLVIMIGVFGLAINPLFFTIQGNFLYILLVNVLVGVSSSAFTLALFCGLLETLPEKNKTVYTSVFNTLINITGFAAPLIGVTLYEHSTLYRAMFYIGLMRLVAWAFFAIRWIYGRKEQKLANSNINLEV